jgi:L-asparagine transporter-like permease
MSDSGATDDELDFATTMANEILALSAGYPATLVLAALLSAVDVILNTLPPEAAFKLSSDIAAKFLSCPWVQSDRTEMH